MANAVVLNLGCTLRSSGEFLNTLMSSRPINQNLWGVEPRYQYFFTQQVEMNSLPPPKKESQRTRHLEGKV